MNLPDKNKRILIAGEVFVDRHLDKNLVRLGGIFHFARTLSAFKATYAAAFLCPSYLDDQCEKYLRELRAELATKIGNVMHSPNIMDIGESTEAGAQFYSELLRDQKTVAVDMASLADIFRNFNPTDLLIVSSDKLRPIHEFAKESGVRIHADLDHIGESDIDSFKDVTTAFCSTSGELFRRCERSPQRLRDTLKNSGVNTAILKENRGGSRLLFAPDTGEIPAPSFPATTIHSVGVGDCFDATWLLQAEHTHYESRMRFSSFIASRYASTFHQSEFESDSASSASIFDQIAGATGSRIAWEDRPSISIYLAAPDFPSVDVTSLDQLESALRYHNFSPHRPVKENGLASGSMSQRQRRKIYLADVKLMEDCALLIAVALNDDPGTFAELGWFAGRQKPTLVFDPLQRLNNLFASNVCDEKHSSIGRLIDSVFRILGSKHVD